MKPIPHRRPNPALPRWAGALALLLLVACRGAGAPASAPLPRIADDDKARALAAIGVAPGWGRPERVPGAVNSDGWEDSAQIARDGRRLFFQYFPGDMFRIEQVFLFHRPKAQGGLGEEPALRSHYHRGPPRGVSPAYTSDTLQASLGADGRFGEPQRFAHARDGGNEWGVMTGDDGALWYVSHDPTVQLNMDLYRNGLRLAIPGREKFQEDNPHFAITPHGRELFFDGNDRPAAKGQGDLWVTRQQGEGFDGGGRWSEPERLAAPVNGDKTTEVQPHLTADGRTLYFTSSRGERIGIWRAERRGANAWAEPEAVLWPTAKGGVHAWGLGEPTLTADGAWLYFVVVYTDGRGHFDADVARVRRQTP